jgi:hypothetical protein
MRGGRVNEKEGGREGRTYRCWRSISSSWAKSIL